MCADRADSFGIGYDDDNRLVCDVSDVIINYLSDIMKKYK
jgi:hypothetical protein